eukprot:SAG22_NODE_2078_length_3044_cov_1.691681_2_plen_53_part_00
MPSPTLASPPTLEQMLVPGSEASALMASMFVSADTLSSLCASACRDFCVTRY